jgi:hypothetical protein
MKGHGHELGGKQWDFLENIVCKVTTKNIQNIHTIKSPTFSFGIPWCTNEWIIDLSMLPMPKPLQPSTRCILELCSERIQNTFQ